MSERKYYVICEDNCKFEGMTREQIITAIQEAVSTGKIKDIDAGFITKIKEQNAGRSLTFWVGTTAEYNAIPEDKRIAECLYIKTDDTFQEEVESKIKEIIELVDETYGKFPPLAEIIITTEQGGKFTCEDENGMKYEPSKQLTTKWVFPVKRYGTFTITGVYNGVERTQTVVVDTVKQYPITFSFYNDTFGNNDWETIIALCKNNAVPDTWKVGDIQSFQYTYLGTTYVAQAQIIGKNHDEDVNGNKAPLTFAFGNGSVKLAMNGTKSNIGGWTETYMYKTTLPSILSGFPSVLKENIRTIKKYTSAGNVSATIKISESKLFLMSEVEYTGTTNYSFSGEGTQYEYLKNGNYLNTHAYSWLRSPCKLDNELYCYKAMNGISVSDPQNALNTYILFCL